MLKLMEDIGKTKLMAETFRRRKFGFNLNSQTRLLGRKFVLKQKAGGCLQMEMRGTWKEYNKLVEQSAKLKKGQNCGGMSGEKLYRSEKGFHKNLFMAIGLGEICFINAERDSYQSNWKGCPTNWKGCHWVGEDKCLVCGKEDMETIEYFH